MDLDSHDDHPGRNPIQQLEGIRTIYHRLTGSEEIWQYILEASTAGKAGSLRAALLMTLAAFEGAVATFAGAVGTRAQGADKAALVKPVQPWPVDDADFNSADSRTYSE